MFAYDPPWFYGLESLGAMVKGETSDFHFLPADRLIRREELALRQNTNDSTTLLEVFQADTSPLPRDSLELPLLLTDVPPPLLQSTAENFWERLNTFSGELLSDLKGIEHLVFAGGAVIGALTGVPAGDIDIFLNCSEAEAEGILRKIYTAVQANQARITTRKMLVTRSKNAVS